MGNSQSVEKQDLYLLSQIEAKKKTAKAKEIPTLPVCPKLRRGSIGRLGTKTKKHNKLPFSSNFRPQCCVTGEVSKVRWGRMNRSHCQRWCAGGDLSVVGATQIIRRYNIRASTGEELLAHVYARLSETHTQFPEAESAEHYPEVGHGHTFPVATAIDQDDIVAITIS